MGCRRRATALVSAIGACASSASMASSASVAVKASRATRGVGGRASHGRRWASNERASSSASKDSKESTRPSETNEADNPLSSIMFPWERAVLNSERWVGELKPWQKAYWAAFGLGCAFVVGARVKRYYEDQETDEERQKAMESNKRALQAALEGRSFIASGETDEDGEDDDPFEGLSPEEIEALVKKQAPTGDVYEGMTPEEINEYEEKFRGKGNLTWKTSASGSRP
jgi:hypothetical protein